MLAPNAYPIAAWAGRLCVLLIFDVAMFAVVVALLRAAVREWRGAPAATDNTPKPTPIWHCRKTVIKSAAGEDYLVRWSLSTIVGSVKLHHILRSDEDRDCHDHPWSFVSIILRGGYWEHRPIMDGARSTWRAWYGPGRILYRPTPSVHRLELPAGRTAWSLVFTGPRVRQWGFHTVCGFIPWIHYAQAKEEGC